MSDKYCFWSVADGQYGKMMESVIKSARNVDIDTDFHIWSDQNINGSVTHQSGTFDKNAYLFKFHFLKNEVSKLNYDYFIFIDADSYFVRKPDNILKVLYGSPVHICMESDCTLLTNKRPDWWGCLLPKYCQLMKFAGVRSKAIYNTNAGFWIVHHDVIDTFYELGMNFWNLCKNNGCYKFTEEPPLAYIGHMLMGNPYIHTLRENTDIWASDWIGWYNNRLPDGKEFEFEDYMSGNKIRVNPYLVHCMRSKNCLLKGI
jgi:hypothetical protein